MTFKTKSGTKLPLTDLHGKDYLEVKYRLVWFREEHPDWAIETELVEASDKHCIAKATVRNAEGRVMSTAHKCEDRQGFSDYREKAETGAIGRALAHVGYGTQFASELEEGERVVDSPILRSTNLRAVSTAQATQTMRTAVTRLKPNDYRIPFGKFKGRGIGEVSPKELLQYCEYLKSEAQKKGQQPSGVTERFLDMVEAYMNQSK